MTTSPPPKRDPPIVPEELGDNFDLVDEADVVDITSEDLTADEIEALENGQPAETISMTRSIIPSIPGVDLDIDERVDKLFDLAILAPRPLPAIALEALPEEKTEPRIVTSKPPPPVVEEEDEDDAFYAQFEPQKA